MYRIKIGCNVKLEKGEKWGGTVWTMPDGSREARMEPGDLVERLPALAALDWLRDRGVIEEIQEAAPGPVPISEIRRSASEGAQEARDG